ncbi:MAG: caspase family protein [Anaerolineae bacterium]|nr:caspase family protein [Anaerolineae bacterium]
MQTTRTTYSPTYHASWALVIGIDDYQHLPQLKTAVHGAQAVARYLRDVLGFTVTELYDNQPSRESILRWFDRLKTDPDDRVLVYFAGHGITHDIKSRSKGFLALAHSDGHWNSLAMDDILDEAETFQAKHVLYLLDACFGGLALRGRSGEFDINRAVEYLLTRPARYAITAGGEEVVDDDAAGEYSLFTHFLLRALDDKTLRADGLLRAKEVGLYIEEKVSAHRQSRALPNHGYLHGSGDGDFLFFWETGPRLPNDLEMALQSGVTEVRGGAVAALIKRARDEHNRELSQMARERLDVVSRTDPSEQVRASARQIFEEEETARRERQERARREITEDCMAETRRNKEQTAQIVLCTEDTIKHKRPLEEATSQKHKHGIFWKMLGILIVIVMAAVIIGDIVLRGW